MSTPGRLKRRSILCDHLMFARAIEFDLYADREFARRGGTDQLMGRDFSSNLLSKNEFLFEHPLLFRFILNLFDRFLWPGLYLYNFLLLLRTLREKKHAGVFSGKLPDTLLLDAAGRQHSRVCLNAGFDRDGTARTVIYLRESYRRFPASIGPSEHYLKFVSRSDIFDAWRQANRHIRITRRILGTSCTVHLVKAMPWFLARTMLDRLAVPGRTICYCNNVDRWFYLFQTYRAVRQENVQHGVMLDLTQAQANTFVPRHAFARIDRLHAFDAAQKSIFRRLYPDIRETVFFTPRIVLTPLEKSGRASVLLVGHVLMFYDLEEQILRMAAAYTEKLDVYLKPHPAYSTQKYQKLLRVLQDQSGVKNPFQLIADSEFFPDVDLVVSYQSSLVLEYGTFGTDSLVYDESTREQAVSAIAKKFEAITTFGKDKL